MSATGKHSITPTHLRVVLAEGAPANWCKPAAHDRRCSASTMPASSSTTGKRPRPPRLPPHLGQCHAVCAQAAGECCWDALVRRVGQLHLEGLSLEQRDHLLAGEEAARVGGMTRREERGTQRGSSNSLRQIKHSAHWQRGVVFVHQSNSTTPSPAKIATLRSAQQCTIVVKLLSAAGNCSSRNLSHQTWLRCMHALKATHVAARAAAGCMLPAAYTSLTCAVRTARLSWAPRPCSRSAA